MKKRFHEAGTKTRMVGSRATAGAVIQALFLCIIVIGCPILDLSGPISETGELVVTIVSQMDDRTIIQPRLNMQIDEYQITVSGPGTDQSATIDSSTETASFSDLVPGSWTVAVEAANSNELIIAGGSAGVSVTAGQTATANVVVVPLSEDGTLTVQLSWLPGTLSVPAITALLTPVGGTGQVIGSAFVLDTTGDPNTAEYSGSWPAGYYDLSMSLRDGTESVSNMVVAVRIIANQVSTGSYSLSGADFIPDPIDSLQIEVGADLNTPYRVSLSGAYAAIGFETAMALELELSPDTEPDSIRWFIDGQEQIGRTTAGLDIGPGGIELAIGKHRVDVLVSKDGMLSSQAAVFTVNSESGAFYQPVTIDAMGYGDQANREGQAWLRIVGEFEEAHPEISIEYELLWDEAYHQRVTSRLASGDVPHLAYMGADARWGTPWAEAGQQFDHRPFLDGDYYDLNLIPSMGPNGEIWEVPLGTSNTTTVLFMNEALVNSLGFDAPETYADLVAMVPAAHAAGLTVVSIDGADGWAWGSCLLSTIIARLSGDANWIQKAVAGQNHFTDQVFVDSLNMITRMLDDGVLDSDCVLVDYGTNTSNFSNEQALFMVQGQWVAGSIDPAVQEHTRMLAWPALPGEQAATAGTVAAVIQVGYGVTAAGAADPAVREAALRFIDFLMSHEETAQRLLNGVIVAPILKNFAYPADIPVIVTEKVALASSAGITDVIDVFLGGAANDALNTGMQQIVRGEATGAQIAAIVEQILRQ